MVCTIHQLFRYYKTFDLLILDEVDAFPLKGNETLLNIAINASRERIIYSTATVNNFLKEHLKGKEYKEVYLPIRPSLKPLIEPKVMKNLKIINMFNLYKIMSNTSRQAIIFLETKKDCELFNFIFNNFFETCFVYSDKEDRDKIIKAFKDKKYQFIFATSVLERGITINGIDVIVFITNDYSFDESSLVQMAGRVGRGICKTDGECYFLTNIKSKEVVKAIENIKKANKEYEMSIL